MNLPELDTDAWIDLELAGTDPNSGFRYVNLCTVDSEGHPQARLIVVLRTRKRARSRSTRDIRTPKWREIDANPSVTVLAFDQAWACNSGCWAQWNACSRQFGRRRCVGPSVTMDTSDLHRRPSGRTVCTREPVAAEPGDESGKTFFGAFLFRASALDWFQIKRGDNRRAIYLYGSDGKLLDAHAINT
jgi:pyridoxamine 5'-phosphate oxidase